MKKLLLICPCVNKKYSRKTGDIVVRFEDLVFQIDKHGFKYFVIDSNKENYTNKITALFCIWYKLLTKTRQCQHVSLHGRVNDYIFGMIFLNTLYYFIKI